jgi:hypothetical protein
MLRRVLVSERRREVKHNFIQKCRNQAAQNCNINTLTSGAWKVGNILDWQKQIEINFTIILKAV